MCGDFCSEVKRLYSALVVLMGRKVPAMVCNIGGNYHKCSWSLYAMAMLDARSCNRFMRHTFVRLHNRTTQQRQVLYIIMSDMKRSIDTLTLWFQFCAESPQQSATGIGDPKSGPVRRHRFVRMQRSRRLRTGQDVDEYGIYVLPWG